MKFRNRWLTPTPLFMFWITLSQGQYICNNTYSWINPHNHPCTDYETNWCANGTYRWDTMWTGGNTYKYPEFNCCACGKEWPLWFVPASGYTAGKAVPEIRMNMTNRLMCNDTYRNMTACTMICKAFPDNLDVTSLATMSGQDFNQSSCTLDLNMNNSLQYILQIPVDNYLMYFSNSTTNQYNFSCVNSTALITSNMLCRYEVDEQPFESPQCPSENITSRYIPPGCVDTKNWTSKDTFSCFEYEVTKLWCANGKFTFSGGPNGGAPCNYPERNCCACGKGSLSPIQSIPISAKNNSINPSEIGIMHLQNCNASANPNYIFDIKCLGPINFINTNNTMNVTFYNCLLDCFFDWNTTPIKETQSINVTRQIYGSSILYYLTSNLFSHGPVVCGSLVYQKHVLTDFSSVPTTSEQITDSSSIPTTSEHVITSQSTIITHNPSTFESQITRERPAVWQPIKCTNGKIGINCDISADTCSISKPCLNNGTCVNTNSSFICLCPPSKFTGTYCEIDIQPCKSYTCLSRGTCIETSPTSFICQCEPGYEGINCESLIDYCRDIKCQHNGQCRPTRLNFTCECTSKDFSGRYCELKSSSLTTKQTVNRSFGYIAIIALVIVAGVIVSMDVLKYVFKIDPVDKERERLEARKKQQQYLKKRRPIVMRFTYVNKPNLETIVEEP